MLWISRLAMTSRVSRFACLDVSTGARGILAGYGTGPNIILYGLGLSAFGLKRLPVKVARYGDLTFECLRGMDIAFILSW